MKKIILLIPIISLFILVSCNKEPEIKTSTNDTTTIVPTNTTNIDDDTKPTNDESNITDSTDKPTNDKNTDVYSDNILWGPFH